jgi:flagellar assembly factor FliW
MKLNTPHLGELTFDASSIFRFPNGLIGFEDLKRYVLVTHPDLRPFTWMVAIDEPDVSFALADPSYFLGTRQAPLSRLDAETLDLDEDDEVTAHVIVTFPSGDGPLLGNVKGPVVLNRTNRLGSQMVLTDEALRHEQPVQPAPASVPAE